MWRELFESCETTLNPWPGYVFAPMPTEETVREFERSRNLQLPRGYVEYCLVFGAGVLANHRIAAPIGTACDFDLAQFSTDLMGPPHERLLEAWIESSDPDDFLLFSSSEFGDFYGWKTTECASDSDNEYSIYLFDHSNRFELIANSFEMFVFECVLKAKPDFTPKRTFSPIQIETT